MADSIYVAQYFTSYEPITKPATQRQVVYLHKSKGITCDIRVGICVINCKWLRNYVWPDDWCNFIFSNSFSCMEKEVFAQYLVWCYRLNQSTHQSNSSNCSVLRKCVQYFLLEITKSLKDLERNEYEIFWSSLALFIPNPSPFILYRRDFISSYLTEYDEGNIGEPVKWNGSHV